MKRIALTGFTPFGSNTVNPTELLVKKLSSLSWINGRIIPVSYSRSGEEILSLEGDAIVMTGLAQGRDKVTIERYAYNERKASISDNDGVLFSGEKIAEEGPAVIETGFNVTELIAKLQSRGYNAALSEDPGRYICNNVYYTSLYHSKRPSLFVHFPGTESMTLDEEERTLLAILEIVKATL